jgi:mRNA interferase HigB
VQDSCRCRNLLSRVGMRLCAKADFQTSSSCERLSRKPTRLGKFTVFNIGGNKVRLIAAVHYNRNKVYTRHVLTHQEYDTGKWKE